MQIQVFLILLVLTFFRILSLYLLTFKTCQILNLQHPMNHVIIFLAWYFLTKYIAIKIVDKMETK